MRTMTGFRRALTVMAVAAVALLSLAPPAGAQQSNLPPTWVFARAYNGWNIVGQQANTYSFNGGVCNYSPSNNGNTPSFFVFSGFQAGSAVYAPVAIIDANSTLSEIVTPTSTTQSSGSCGFAGSVLNSHVSFVLQSGTAGLQEAVFTQNQTSPVFDVILDKNWYQSLAGLPGPPNPATVIAALTGNVNVGIVDTTTLPWTSYRWNGTNYVAVSAPGAVAFTSVTAVSAPTALSTAALTNGILTTATTGGSIPASSTYRLGITYVTANGGETTISTESASTSTIATGSGTATNTISVTSPAAATGAVGYRLYMTAASGSTLTEILYTPTCTASTLQTTLPGVCAIGSNATISAIITGTATVPAISNAFITPTASTSPLQSVPGSFPPFTNIATIAAAATSTIGAVNLPAGYLNSLGRTIQVCGNGFGTTNSTPGTLTVASTLASIPGVTSITPFTAVSGTTTASAVVSFNFCFTSTTTATGATGTVEEHGWVNYNLAGTAVASPTMDIITAASSTIDLTKQDQLAITLKCTTTAVTTGGAQLRQLTVQVIQ